MSCFLKGSLPTYRSDVRIFCDKLTVVVALLAGLEHKILLQPYFGPFLIEGLWLHR